MSIPTDLRLARVDWPDAPTLLRPPSERLWGESKAHVQKRENT